MKRTPSHTDKIALLGAFSMFLSTIEYLLPKPVPFMRLGLANLPLLLGLEVLSPSSYFLLVLIKVIGQALVNGTLASYVFVFSLFGTLASAVVMRLCYMLPKTRISFIGISLMGALASNMVQILLSVEFIFGRAAWRILPVFLAAGLLSGFFIGLFAVYFSTRSKWWQDFSGNGELSLTVEDIELPEAFTRSGKKKRRTVRKKRDIIGLFISPVFRFWIGLLIIPAWLFIENTVVKALYLGIFLLLAFLSGKRIRIIYFVVLTCSITLFHLLIPNGRVLFELGRFKITEEALIAGLNKAMTICGLVMLSLFSVSVKLRLPGRFGGLLAGTFFYFEKILDSREKIASGGRLSVGNFMASIDRLLSDLFTTSEPETEETVLAGNTAASLLYALFLAGSLWAAVLWQNFWM